MYNSYSVLGVTITGSLAPIFSIIFLHLRRFKASLSFMHKSSTSLTTTSFHVFLGQSLSGSINLHSNTLFHPVIVIFSLNVSIPSQSSSLYDCYYVFCSTVPNCCLKSKQNSLSLNFTPQWPHIHLTIFISAGAMPVHFLFSMTISLVINFSYCRSKSVKLCLSCCVVVIRRAALNNRTKLTLTRHESNPSMTCRCYWRAAGSVCVSVSLLVCSSVYRVNVSM